MKQMVKVIVKLTWRKPFQRRSPNPATTPQSATIITENIVLKRVILLKRAYSASQKLYDSL